MAKVLEIKNGWIRYSIGSIFNDNRMPIPKFLSMYRKMGPWTGIADKQPK